MSRDTSTRREFLALGGTALAAAVAGCGADATEPTDSTQGEQPSPSPPSPTTREPTVESTYTQLYQETVDSVLLVRTRQGQGTGFVYDDQHVITNAHVVGQAQQTQLRFNDGTWTEGTVIGTDVHSDLAVVQAQTMPDVAASLSFQTTPPTIGQRVAAIGNPYNLDGSLTSGLVSGTDRLIPAPSGYRIPDAIQTDAAVNPGNSGGPLMNLDGRVLGVVNSKRGDNIAFGISAALTQQVVPRLIQTGDYEHSYLGVALDNMTPALADANGLAAVQGLLVREVVPDGPAAGVLIGSQLQVTDGGRVPVGGDVILQIGGTQVSTVEDIASYLALQTRPGESVTLRVLRDGQQQSVQVTLGSRPERSRSPLR